MGKELRKMLAVLIAMALLLSPIGGLCDFKITANAASAKEYDKVQRLFPKGTVLKSDMFPGLKVTFNGKQTLTVDENAKNVNLSITVLDEKLAVKSLQIIRCLFGPLAIQNKVGQTSNSYMVIRAVTENEYEKIIDSLGNAMISNLLDKILDPEVTDEEIDDMLADFFELLASAQVTQEEQDKLWAAAEATKAYPNENEEYYFDDYDFDEYDFDDEDEKVKYDRVIMMFMDLTNLETLSEFGTINLLDLLRADIPDNTKIIITTGGTKKWHMNDYNAYKNYAKELLYRGVNESDLKKEDYDKIDAKALELFDLYKTDVGRGTLLYEVVKDENGINRMDYMDTVQGKYMLDKTYLTDFINYCTNNYQADKYDLILSDHGGGIGGFGGDEIYEEDLANKKTTENPDVSFSIKNMREAIADSDYVKNGKKLDFLGFDACQMSTVEVALAFKDSADYLIMSEENEPGRGWNFYAWMNKLNEDPKMTTEDLGKIIVDTYMEQYEHYQNFNVTLSAIETAKLDEVDKALTDFSKALSQETNGDPLDYIALAIEVGKNSDYGNKSGYYTSGLLDVVKLCKVFTSLDNNFSDDLKDASNNLIDAIQNSIVKARGLDDKYGNTGLSMNFPLNPYAVAPAGKNEKGEDNIYPSYNAENIMKLLDEISSNPDYRKVYAELSLYNLIARIIGDNWLNGYNEFTTQSVKDTLLDENDPYHAQSILKAAGINLNNANEPVYQMINKLYEGRVEKSQISVQAIDKEGEKFPSQAMVVLNGANADVINENITVRPILQTGVEGKEISIGSTPAFTDNRTVNKDDGSVTWIVNAYDSKWYTLNDQISSFYVTYLDNDLGFYYGYIPLAYWNDIAAVKDDGTKTREAYIKEQNNLNNLTPIRLNVSLSFNKDDPEKTITEYKFVNYDSVSNGGEITGTYELDGLTGLYFELLGGGAEAFVNGLMDETIYSLGTVYGGDEGIEKNLKLELHTIKDVLNYYYVTDIYGNDYDINKEKLGSTGLDNYRKEYDEYDNSFQQSQILAEQVRDAAAKKADELKAQAEQAAQTESQKSRELVSDLLTRSDSEEKFVEPVAISEADAAEKTQEIPEALAESEAENEGLPSDENTKADQESLQASEEVKEIEKPEEAVTEPSANEEVTPVTTSESEAQIEEVIEEKEEVTETVPENATEDEAA